jgi:adenylate cyclase
MLRSLKQLNQELALEGKPALAVGVGIHTGPAIVGSVGSPERLEYTAIGSTVNFASRIEHLTKLLGTPLLLSESTRSQLRGRLIFKEFPPQQVRGLEEPVKLFSVAEEFQ